MKKIIDELYSFQKKIDEFKTNITKDNILKIQKMANRLRDIRNEYCPKFRGLIKELYNVDTYIVEFILTSEGNKGKYYSGALTLFDNCIKSVIFELEHKK